MMGKIFEVNRVGFGNNVLHNGGLIMAAIGTLVSVCGMYMVSKGTMLVTSEELAEAIKEHESKEEEKVN